MKSMQARLAGHGAKSRLASLLQLFKWAPFVLLMSAVVLGGGGWNLSGVALTLMGWWILAGAAWLQWRTSVPRWGVVEWCAVGLPALLLVTQTLPLPPSVFAALPGRGMIQSELELAGAAGIWRPLSLDVSASFRAAAAMLPAAAMLVCVRGMSDKAVLTLCRLLVGLACMSVLLGILQVAGGPTSGFRLYNFHNLTGALGFFAYRNHQAAFLLMVVPIAVSGLLTRGGTSSGRAMTRSWMLAAIVVTILLLGIAMTFSRAGLVLGMALLGGGGTVLAWTTWQRARGWNRVSSAALVGFGGLLLIAWVAMHAPWERFGESLWDDARWGLYERVVEVGSTYQPIGAGLGAFEQVFQGTPENVALLGAYMNHAHNEWLQLWLELGWLGVFLTLIALATLGRAGWRVWQKQVVSSASARVMLARAASISLLIGTVHAYFDYVLRSSTNMVVIALLVALLWREAYPRAPDAA